MESRNFLITYLGSQDGRNFHGNLTLTTKGNFPSYEFISENVQVENDGIIIMNIYEFKNEKDYNEYSFIPKGERNFEEFKKQIVQLIMRKFNFPFELAETALENKNIEEVYNKNLSIKESFEILFDLFKNKEEDED